jgi:uncharacterized membrane protein YccC
MGTRAATMDQIPGGASTGIATLAAAVVAGLLWLRRFLSSDRAGRAATDAQAELINLLREQITQERARANAAETSRDAAYQQIGALRTQVYDLTDQVRALKAQVAALTPATT